MESPRSSLSPPGRSAATEGRLLVAAILEGSLAGVNSVVGQRRAVLLPARRRRKLLDETGDVADLVVADEALPRCHRGAGPSLLDDPEEVVLRPLEPLKTRGGRGSLGIDTVALRALRHIR